MNRAIPGWGLEKGSADSYVDSSHAGSVSWMKHVPYIVIGNSGNKRMLGIQQARASLGLQPPIMLTYLELLEWKRSGRHLTEMPELMAVHANRSDPDRGPVLRLDASGDHFGVEMELIALGAEENEGDDSLLPMQGSLAKRNMLLAEQARALQPHPGRIWYPAQWFRGYCRLLAWLRSEMQLLWPGHHWINDPVDIPVMFDKRCTSIRLASAGVRVPQSLYGHSSELFAQKHRSSDLGLPGSGEELRESLRHAGMHRAFIKLFCGSAASGVMAYQFHPGTGEEIAQTTIGMEHRRGELVFYNSGRLQRYTDAASIGRLLDWLCHEGVHVERWIPKASVHGKAFDVRQLVHRGQACHAVLRASRTPITNLHLRNERLQPEDSGLSIPTLQQVAATAEQALAAFPHSTTAGVDVLVPADGSAPYVVDMNPYGDLLYHVRYKGMDTYTWEMAH
ncbi:hypothetical protein D3C74_09010 [compost metagenome]